MKRSLAAFVEDLADRGELVRIDDEVDPVLDVAAITQRAAQASGPALLFSRLKGHSTPVVTNLLGSPARVCRALGIESLDELAGRVEQLVTQVTGQSWFDRLKNPADPSPLAKFEPRLIKTGPCQQVVRLGRDIDLAGLPLIKCWPEETDRLITAGHIVFHPDGGDRTVLPARLRLVDRHRLAVLDDGHGALERTLAAFRRRGEKLPIAVVVGGSPVHSMAAWGAAAGIDGYLLAGILEGQAIDLVRCRNIPLDVPSEADFVLEGLIDPAAEPVPSVVAGLASGNYQFQVSPVLTVITLTQKSNPLWPAIIPEVRGGEIAVLRKITERLWLPLVQRAIAELVDYALPIWGGLHTFAVMAIHKTRACQAQQAASALWGLTPLAHTKFVIVVDEHVHVHAPQEVWAQVGANVDPGRDLFLHSGPAHLSDHAASAPPLGRQIGLDATAKLPGEHPAPWPTRLTMPSEIIALAEECLGRLVQ